MNGYHEGLACEHRYIIGETVCGDPAFAILQGVAYCETHLEDRLAAVQKLSPPDAADLRMTAKYL